MPETFTLSIPKPCHERWDTFTKTEKGGFCAACQTEVIDFTQWSDEQIRQYMSRKNERVCGRFKPEQLKTYGPAANNTVLRWTPAALLLPMLFTAIESTAQTQVTPAPTLGTPVVQYAEPEPQGSESKRLLFPRDIFVRGIVRSQTDSNPIPGATVIRKGTTQGTNVDFDGNFSMTIKDAKPTEILTVSFIGYVPQTIEVSDSRELTILLAEDIQELTGIIIVTKKKWWSPKRLWWKIKNIF